MKDLDEMSANVCVVGTLQRPSCASPDGSDGEAVREVLNQPLDSTNDARESKAEETMCCIPHGV